MGIKQVIILRKDLNMRKGKMIAQGAHASMKVFFDMMFQYGDKDQSLEFGIRMTPEMKDWYYGDFKKVALSVDSEEELLEIYNKAKEADIPCSLIIDNGLTEFDSVKTKTAVAIGPDNEDKINEITGSLKLL